MANAVSPLSRAEVIAAARAQRGVLLVILGNLGVIALRLGTGNESLGAISFVIVLPLAMYFAYRLAAALRIPRPLVYSLAMLFPCISILALFYLSEKATKAIRARGHKVGLLGADVAALEAEGRD